MVERDDNFYQYRAAFTNKKYQDALEILTKIINILPSTDKERAITYYQLLNYQEVLDDCKKLVDLGFSIDHDDELAIIEPEAQLKITKAAVMNKLKNASINLKLDIAETFYLRLEAVDENGLFERTDYTPRPVTTKRKK